MPLFSVATFLSAFLLFIIQPLLTKKLLPLFGSAPSVWLCMVLFFQTTLLLGYLYAYLLTKLPKLSTQVLVHAGLMCLSLVFLPITPSEQLALTSTWAPPFTILWLLSACILFPIILLSASSPLLQYWYCHRYQTDFPYRYYALSNLGSLLGLLIFPAVLEPSVGLTWLLYSWSFGFGFWLIFLIGCLIVTYQRNTAMNILPQGPADGTLNAKSISVWLVLTFLSSALLLSTTQMMMQDILNLPLLWILPLGLYLISYIITFSYPRIYHRWTWFVLFGVLTCFVLLLSTQHELPLAVQMAVFSLLLFSGCMICHGELIAAKPSKMYLTHFYLFIAIGGVLGGVFVNLIAPLIFNQWWDFYLPLNGIFLVGGALAYPHIKNSFSQRALKGVWIGGTVLIELLLFYQLFSVENNTIFNERNFFGKAEVVEFTTDDKLQRTLRHGHILHGHQYLHFPDRQFPTTYYSTQSGLARAIDYERDLLRAEGRMNLRIGVVGLGTGTIAALAQTGDFVRFYEIDPDMVNIAKNYFFYLTDSKATIDIVLGDGRLSLQDALNKNQPQRFDVLAVDAFSGDAVPLHLLTIEALKLYMQHLTPNGILAFHISSRYVDLYPALQAAAQELGIYAHLTHNSGEYKKYISSSEWLLLTRDTQLGLALYQHSALFFREDRVNHVWTDDFNYLFSAIRW